MVEKKADWLENTEPKKQPESKFPGFSFGLLYPALSAGEASNPEMPMGHRPKKAP